MDAFCVQWFFLFRVYLTFSSLYSHKCKGEDQICHWIIRSDRMKRRRRRGDEGCGFTLFPSPLSSLHLSHAFNGWLAKENPFPLSCIFSSFLSSLALVYCVCWCAGEELDIHPKPLILWLLRAYEEERKTALIIHNHIISLAMSDAHDAHLEKKNPLHVLRSCWR